MPSGVGQQGSSAQIHSLLCQHPSLGPPAYNPFLIVTASVMFLKHEFYQISLLFRIHSCDTLSPATLVLDLFGGTQTLYACNKSHGPSSQQKNVHRCTHKTFRTQFQEAHGPPKAHATQVKNLWPCPITSRFFCICHSFCLKCSSTLHPSVPNYLLLIL